MTNGEFIGWVILTLALLLVAWVLYSCLVMASKYDDISEEYWSEEEDDNG